MELFQYNDNQLWAHTVQVQLILYLIIYQLKPTFQSAVSDITI